MLVLRYRPAGGSGALGAARSCIRIGRLGALELRPGWYAYAGSARGPGGIAGRVRHHGSPVRRPHWHLDWLRPAVEVRELWHAPAERCSEHELARALRRLPGAALPLPGFGSSDCDCPAHLVHLPRRPSARDLEAAFGAGPVSGEDDARCPPSSRPALGLAVSRPRGGARSR